MSIITCRSHHARDTSPRQSSASTDTHFHFMGGMSGAWRVTSIVTHSGQSLPNATHVEIANGDFGRTPAGTAWVFHGVARNTRFVTREEPRRSTSDLTPVPHFGESCAALILVRRSPDWWRLTQGDRNEVLELPSGRLRQRINILPSLLRLMPRRNAMPETFDSVTWFEYMPQDAAIFDDLAGTMRTSEEWKFVDREIVIKLTSDFGNELRSAQLAEPPRPR